MPRPFASLFAGWAVGLGMFALSCAAAAQDNAVLSLGTATAGGGFVAYGDALAATLAEIDPGLRVEPHRTAGSAENIPLLEAGRLDIALVQGEAAHEALNGIGRPRADLRIIAAMYPTPGLFIIRADSPYRSIADLRGQPVAFGARGSGFVILARPALPDDIAYRFTRALHLGEAALASLLPQARDTTAANTVSAVPDLKLLPRHAPVPQGDRGGSLNAAAHSSSAAHPQGSNIPTPTRHGFPERRKRVVPFPEMRTSGLRSALTTWSPNAARVRLS